MIIKNLRNKDKPSYGRELEVFGIYWNDEGMRLYFVVPYDGYNGFLVLNEKETQIIDPEIRDVFVIRKNDAGNDLLLHWAADKDNLIYDLIDHDPIAMEEFKRRLLLKSIME